MADKTIFARIIDREIPARIVFEDDQVLAFHDVNPQAPVHVLVIPKRAIDRIENMKPSDEPLLGHMVWAATEVARTLKLNDGYRVVINNGEHAGQSVFHIHVHLLGGRHLGWPPG